MTSEPTTVKGRVLLEQPPSCHEGELCKLCRSKFGAAIVAIEQEARAAAERAASGVPAAYFVAAEEARAAAERDVAVLLAQHYVTAIDCDHMAATDTVRCSCSVWTGTPQPSVGAAVQEWVNHVIAETADTAQAEHAEPDIDVTRRLGDLTTEVTAWAVVDEARRAGWQRIETPLRKAWQAARRLPLAEHNWPLTPALAETTTAPTEPKP